jgi:hypothetical protein
MIKERLGIESIDTNNWLEEIAIDIWWASMSSNNTPNGHGIHHYAHSNERNTRVFCNKSAPTIIFLKTIKDEAKFWVIAGAEHLSIVISGD